MNKSSTCLKIFLIGCAFCMIATVVVVVAGGYIVEKWLGNLIATEDSSYGKRISALKQKHTFSPRKDGLITDDQLSRVLKIAKRCSEMLNSAELKKEIEKAEKSINPHIDGFRFWMKFGNQWREILLEGLQENQMSLAEYHYVHKNALKSWAAFYRKQAQEGAGKSPGSPQTPVPQIPDEVKKVIDDVTQVPESNLEVIAKHREDVDKYLASAPFAKLIFPMLVETESDSLF